MARKSRIFEETEKIISTEKIYKSGIYARLSDKDDRKDEDNSIGNQQKVCLDFIKSKIDITVVDFYVDNGLTGTNFDRDEFKRLMNDAICGKINCIIVKDLSRFGRDYIEASEYIENILPGMGVRFVAVNDMYDSLNGHDGITMPFKNIANDFYAKDTSFKIRSSIALKMRSGEYLPASGSVPYGYKKDNTSKTYVKDTVVTAVIQKIFDLRSKGYAFNYIANVLNAENIPSPARLRFLRGMNYSLKAESSLWTRSTIRRILNDPVYLGHRVHGKVRSDQMGAPKKRIDQEMWQYIYNAHEPIIDEALFKLVRTINKAQLQKQSECTKFESADVFYRDCLRDKIFCGNCGERMSAMKRNQRKTSIRGPVTFYQCKTYLKTNRNLCKNHYILESAIINELTNALSIQMQLVLDTESLMEKVQNEQKGNRYFAELKNKRKCLQLKVNNLKGKQDQLLEDYHDGLLDKEEYFYIKTKYINELDTLVLEEADLTEKEQDKQKNIDKLTDWIKTLKEYGKSGKIDKEIVDGVFEKILIFDDKSIEIRFKCKNEYKDLLDYFDLAEAGEQRAI